SVPPALSARLTALESNIFSSAHVGEVTFADISSDGKLVVTASADKTARVWDRAARTSVGEPLIHDALVNCARFSPDGQRVVTSTVNRTFRVWDAQSGLPLSDTLQSETPVASVSF